MKKEKTYILRKYNISLNIPSKYIINFKKIKLCVEGGAKNERI